VAAGGIAACEISRNERMIPSTRISPLGLVGNKYGHRLNIRDFAVGAPIPSKPIKVVLSLGTSMNAGKTFTSTSLVRGLKAAGFRVAAIKATGTGAGNDLWIVRDAGADVVLDFTDGGLASTYLIPLQEIVTATKRLICSAAQQGCDVAVVEVADGLQHLETAEVVQAEELWADCVGVVFAAYDSMGAKCGVDMLKAAGHNVLAVSGRLTQSPLMVRETERSTGLPVYTPWEIQDGALTPLIMNSATTSYTAVDEHHRVEISKHDTLRPTTSTTETPLEDEDHVLVVSSFSNEQRVRELLKLLAEKVMAIEISSICGAGLGERCPSRSNRRNGYRRQRWETGIGWIELNVPRVRKGGYHPIFLRNTDLSAEEMAFMVAQAATPDATPLDLHLLLDRIGMTDFPANNIIDLSSEMKQKARQIGLPSAHSGSTLPSRKVLPHALSQRPSIKSEYGVIGGYGEDDGEMDPFIRVETMPMMGARRTSGVG